jgi:hypothetical protein
MVSCSMMRWVAKSEVLLALPGCIAAFAKKGSVPQNLRWATLTALDAPASYEPDARSYYTLSIRCAGRFPKQLVEVSSPVRRLDMSQDSARPGSISIAAGSNLVDCVVQRSSASGAQLKVSSASSFPRRFELSDGASWRAATVVWRTTGLLGVRFDDYFWPLTLRGG